MERTERGVFRAMSRKSKHRRRARRARRVLERKEKARARLLGILPGKWRSIESETEVPGDRIHRERWMSLQARGGPAISFVGTGFRVPIDFNDPLAEYELTYWLTKAYLGEVDET